MTADMTAEQYAAAMNAAITAATRATAGTCTGAAVTSSGCSYTAEDERDVAQAEVGRLNAELAIALEHKTQLESENLMLRHPDNCELLHHNLYEESARADAAPEAAGPFALSIPVKARLKVHQHALRCRCAVLHDAARHRDVARGVSRSRP